MKDLTNSVLKEATVRKNFDNGLLTHWEQSKSIQFDLPSMLSCKQMFDIPKEQAINYIELFNLIITEEDAKYFIKLLKHNLHNEESIGLLLNAAYLVYYENHLSEGLQFFFNWLLDNSGKGENTQFFMTASQYLL